MTTVRRNDAVGGDSAVVTDLTDEGNHQRVVSAVLANSSAAFSCKNDESLLTSQSPCVFSLQLSGAHRLLFFRNSLSHTRQSQQQESKIVGLV